MTVFFFPVARMSFWSENYSFIKDVYDTRVSKMIEWMDHVEMAIQKVITSSYYTIQFKVKHGEVR